MGFMVPRTTMGMPLVMPPSSPPALLVGRTKPSEASPRLLASYSMGSWTSEPTRLAQSLPSPISTALNAWIPMTAAAIRESSFSCQLAQVPMPGGQPKTWVSTRPPTVSLLTLALRMCSMIFSLTA